MRGPTRLLLLGVMTTALALTMILSLAGTPSLSSTTSDAGARDRSAALRGQTVVSLNRAPLRSRSVRLAPPASVAEDEADRPGAGRHSRRYTKMRCVGDMNHIEQIEGRSCVFENLCYHVPTGEFRFHNRPRNPAVFYDAQTGERRDLDDGEARRGFIALQQTLDLFQAQEWNTFTPRVVAGPSPAHGEPQGTVVLEGTHALWSTWADDDNLGHLLWEELAQVWYSMLRLDVHDDDVQLLHLHADLPARKLHRKYSDAFLPAISSMPSESLRPYMARVAKGNANLCFDQVVVSSPQRRFRPRAEPNNVGHEPLFLSLRDRILLSHGLRPDRLPTSHRLAILNKTRSLRPGTVGRRTFANFEDVVDMARKRYPDVKVDVYDPSDLTITAQLERMLDTTVLLAPAGGIGMLAPFLPSGAVAIFLDYPERDDFWFIGTKAGDSVSMEGAFWSHWPHFKTRYYQVRGTAELVADKVGTDVETANWRDDVSVRVDLNRVAGLLDSAFYDMAP